MVIGDYYPRREKAEPDPDAVLDALIESRFSEALSSRRCGPHACKGCTCRTDPRQLTLPFGEVVNL